MPRRLNEEISGLQMCDVAHVEGMARRSSLAAPSDALPAWAVLLLCLWSVLVGSLLLWLGYYSMQEGDRGVVVREVENQPGLVAHFFLHPQCPCSAASVEELDRLITRLGGKSDLHLIAHVFEPANASHDWAASAMVARLRRMPGMQVRMDPLGKQGETLGVKSSGHLLIYRDGLLRFSGGITAMRGHAGRSTSAQAAYLALMGQDEINATIEVDWLVFGCPILADFQENK